MIQGWRESEGRGGCKEERKPEQVNRVRTETKGERLSAYKRRFPLGLGPLGGLTFMMPLPIILKLYQIDIGGSAWESNPPTAFSRRHTGFEVRGPHQ